MVQYVVLKLYALAYFQVLCIEFVVPSTKFTPAKSTHNLILMFTLQMKLNMFHRCVYLSVIRLTLDCWCDWVDL